MEFFIAVTFLGFLIFSRTGHALIGYFLGGLLLLWGLLVLIAS
jgi:hypothetical protein